jgi:general secretion pathway protein I
MTRSQQGFTLLEVIVAVVILSVGLSALFTSEGGAIRLAQRARTTTVATLLARCKMAEIEEQIMKEGFPTDGLDGRDECCEDAEHKGFSCEWKVERIVLPAELGGEEEGEDGKPGEEGKGGALGSLQKSLGGEGKEGAKTDPASAMGIPLGGAGGILGSIGASMGGGGEGDLDDDPIGSLLLEMTFPIMKPVIEEQVRRATVSVHWTEGSAERNFEVMQFLVNEAEFIAPDEDEEGAVPGAGTSTAPPRSGSGRGKAPVGGT